MPEAVADISNFTGVFRANLTGDNRRITKRNRQPISCASCRARKSKCDRQQPCGACIKRDDGTSCEYGSSAALPPVRGKEHNRNEAQARLQKLEEMVSEMISTSTQAPGKRPPPVKEMPAKDSADLSEHVANISFQHRGPAVQPSSRYFLSSDDTDPSFVGATHWTAILDSLHDIRDTLGRDTEQRPEHLTRPIAHDMYFGPIEPISMEQILAALPSRSVMDNVLSVYFSNKFFLTPFMHAPQFTRAYNKFWDNPASASLMWLSALFSSLCIGTTIAVRCGRVASLGLGDITPKQFMDLAGQCIVSGQYMRVQPYGIEALLLYTHSNFIQCAVDPDPALWAIVSLVVRLAQKQGMHRQPEKLPEKFSPFEAEMRRRCWMYIEVFDLMLSVQLGMPPITHDNECDIGPPTNIHESDIDEDTLIAPAERPWTEKTNMLFYAVKSRMLRIYRRVVRHALSVQLPDYSSTLALDAALHEAYAQTPAVYKIRPIRLTPFTDGIHDIMHRLLIEMIFLKNLCILHRTYLSYDKTNPAYEQSREKCTWAALRILELQAEFHYESRPGGRLHEDKWILTSLTMHDFLLAAMIVGVRLLDVGEMSRTERMKLLGPLTTSYNIWSEKKGFSRDAVHACRVLGSIFAKVQGSGSSASNIPDPGQILQVAPTSTVQPTPTSIPEMSNGTSASSTTFTDSTSPPAIVGGTNDFQNDLEPLMMDGSFDYMDLDLDSLDAVLGDMQNLNWATIDNYVLDTGGNNQGWDPSVAL